MNLRDLKVINNEIYHPEYGDGKINSLYAIYNDNSVSFCAEVVYTKNNKRIYSLTGIDVSNNEITALPYCKYLLYLKYVIKVSYRDGYENIYKMLESKKYNKCTLSNSNCFIMVDDEIDTISYESDSYFELLDNKNKIKNDVAILYVSNGLSTSYCEICKEDYNKSNFNNVDLSTKAEIFIKYNNDYYSEFGNIKRIINLNQTVGFIVEPLETTLLNNITSGNINFQNVTPLEMISIMLTQSKVTKLANPLPDGKFQKYRYVTFIQNIEINEDELIIGELILSKTINDVNFSNFKMPKNNFVYASIYTSAKNIADAIDISQKKIKNILNFVELTQKNSMFFEMYNEKEAITNWDINNLFVDYKIDLSYIIYNVINPKQIIYNDFASASLKKKTSITENDEILKYYEELEKILYLPNFKVGDLYESIYWLNKGLNSIDHDLNKSVIYLNIAYEYVTKGEKGESFLEHHHEISEFTKELKKFVKEKVDNKDVSSKMIEIIMNGLTGTTLPNRFDCMLKRLGITFSENETTICNKMRKARNAIIHKEYKIEIFKHDIIVFYIMLSRVIFIKMVKESNENI